MATFNETISIFFGCYAQSNSTGGVGMVTFKSKGTDRTIKKLSLESSQLYGGSLLVVKDKYINTNPPCQYGYVHLPDSSSNKANHISLLPWLQYMYCVILIHQLLYFNIVCNA